MTSPSSGEPSRAPSALVLRDHGDDGSEAALVWGLSAEERLRRDLSVYLSAGVDALLLENMHDFPCVAENEMEPEIAAAMLQRQQASAVVAARQKIVEGAVGMVESALEKLSTLHIIELDEERKAAMVSNLLVVLCGDHNAQPVVNAGSLYT